MKSRVLILFCLGSFLLNPLFAQKGKIGFFITKNIDTISIYKRVESKKEKYDILGNPMVLKDFYYDGSTLYYANKSGEGETKKLKGIVEIQAKGELFTRDRIGSLFGIKGLHRIVAENQKYVLSEYYFNGDNLWYLLDKQSEKFLFKKAELIIKKDKDVKFYKEKIAPYFKDCPAFIKAMDIRLSKKSRSLQTFINANNRTHTSYLLREVSNIKCD